MQTYFTIIVFLFGMLLGSFYNVVGYRIPNNMSIVKPNSFCPKCRHELKWYELIPVFSFLIQKGRCRQCKSRISLFYPIMELTTGILFAASYLVFGFSFEFVMSILVVSFLIIVIVSDTNFLIIPDEITVFFLLITLLVQFIFKGYSFVLSSILYGAFMFSMMYIVMLLGKKILKEEALGGGDVKLMFFVGIILNVVTPIVLTDLLTWWYLINGFFHVFLASCLAAPFAVFSVVSKKGRAIPFGPFILASLFIIYIFSFDIITFF